MFFYANMSFKSIVFVLLITVIIITGFAFMVTGSQPDVKEAAYSVSDTDRPKAEVKISSYDFGNIKVSDVKSKEFTLKNIGTQPLQILNINSSCGCTKGQVFYKDFKSNQYGMHAQSGFVTEIAPGDTAAVNVIYNPSLMPVYGRVEREVYLTTNDPINQKVIFSVKAFVK